jgi:hypothetical protein
VNSAVMATVNFQRENFDKLALNRGRLTSLQLLHLRDFVKNYFKNKISHLPAAYLLSATEKKVYNLGSMGMFLISLLNLRRKLIGPLKITSLLLHLSHSSCCHFLAVQFNSYIDSNI